MAWFYQPGPVDGQACFFGDPMPYWDGERFRLYYIIDQEHHTQNRGLGSHRVAHLSSADLRHWTKHPVAIAPGGADAVDRHTICTGSVIPYKGGHRFYYSTRVLADGAGLDEVRQVVCVADSKDGVTFEKSARNPILRAPEGFRVCAFRDPFVFCDPANGLYHMLVTGARPAKVAWRDGVLLRYTSKDQENWVFDSVAYEPGTGDAPECPELFEWNGWYYLIFSIGAVARYRVGKSARGPWTTPVVDTLDGPWAGVFRTAPFKEGRRIAVGFVGTREGDKDNGVKRYAGKAVFREVFQRADGTLRAAWLPEMREPAGEWSAPAFEMIKGRGTVLPGLGVALDGTNGLALARAQMPGSDGLVRVKIIPEKGAHSFGITLRCEGALHLDRGYWLSINPLEGRVKLTPLHIPLGRETYEPGLFRCGGLGEAMEVEVLMEGGIIDVMINGERCLVNNYPEVRGGGFYVWVLEGTARFEQVGVAASGRGLAVE